MKKVLKWILRCGILLLLIAGIIVAMNFTFIKRGFTYPFETEITNSSWYSPKAEIAGDNATNYKLADSLSLNKSVLQEISTYAKNRNSNALLVLHNGTLQLEQYWGGSTKESTTNSMSMVKTIIGMLIGVAIDEGKIKSETETAATYITEWANDERKVITIEDLLLMQSGLRKDDNPEDMFSDVVSLYLGTDVEKVALNIPLEKKPASVFEYNNANSQILGIILERATGQSLEAYTASKLWNHIGASNAGWWLDDKDGMPKAFCCYFAQAEDWLILGQLLLQSGKWNDQQIIPEAWVQKMLTQSKIETDYGYHLWLNYEDGGRRQKDRTVPFIIENYSIDGANKQHVFVVPNHNLVIVRIGEKPQEWDESYLVNKVVASLQE